MTAGTLAHELGHNFGLVHNPTDDTDPCYCPPEGYCVMDAYTADAPPQIFSDCQKESLKNYLEHGKSLKLKNDHRTKNIC